MAGKRIFISYSRRDTEYVSTLAEALRKQGFDVWFDKNIRTGSDWDDTLEEELKKADTIVLVLSKTSVASENVKDEMSYVMNMGKVINPIKIEECDVPMRLARKQYVDFTILGAEAGFERLVSDIRKNLEISENAEGVPKGSFKPPKPMVDTTNSVPKRRNKIVPYLIGGLVAVILIVILASQVEDEATDSEVSNIESTEVVTNDPEWDYAQNSRSVDNYLKYIKNAGPDGEYVADAQDSIFALLPYEGMVLYQDADGYKYFSKLLFTDQNGNLDFGNDDSLPPRKYDILTPIESVDVWDQDDKQIIEGANIMAGDKVEVLAVEYPDDNSIWVKIAYSDR